MFLWYGIKYSIHDFFFILQFSTGVPIPCIVRFIHCMSKGSIGVMLVWMTVMEKVFFPQVYVLWWFSKLSGSGIILVLLTWWFNNLI